MAALERNLQCVLTDQAHVLDPKLFGGQALDASQSPRRARFTSTLRARARPPELLARVRAAVPVLPRDLHHLALAIDIDVEWKRVGVLQWLSLPDVDHRQLAEGLDGGAGRHL